MTEIKDIPADAKDDCGALITLKYTQSNSVTYAADGQTIRVGAGQRSKGSCLVLLVQRLIIGISDSLKRIYSITFLGRYKETQQGLYR